MSQWNRATGFYPVGWGFESLRSHQFFINMKTLNVVKELCVYENFPKLCDHIIADYNNRWDDDYILEYLEKLGYQIIYTKTENNVREVSFIDDSQYLDFVLKHA